jgi:DNA polymerase alpha subunit B
MSLVRSPECFRVQLGSDRLGRIAGHILSQQSFYPLYPPAEEMNLDLELWAKYAALEVTPHILILPSDLRCFVKVSSSLLIFPSGW